MIHELYVPYVRVYELIFHGGLIQWKLLCIYYQTCALIIIGICNAIIEINVIGNDVR